MYDIDGRHLLGYRYQLQEQDQILLDYFARYIRAAQDSPILASQLSILKSTEEIKIYDLQFQM